MKKIFVTFLVLLISVCFMIPTFATEFSDLSADHWAHDNIIKLVDDGVITGYPDGTYGPENEITRGEFLKLIMIALYGEDDYFNAYGFLKQFHWALPYGYEASKEGFLMDGTSLDNLDDSISRKEMVHILAKICLYYNIEDYTSVNEKEFNDIAELDDDTKLYIEFVAKNGLITGYTDGTFGADRNMTRAEVATVLIRFLDLYE